MATTTTRSNLTSKIAKLTAERDEVAANWRTLGRCTSDARINLLSDEIAAAYETLETMGDEADEALISLLDD